MYYYSTSKIDIFVLSYFRTFVRKYFRTVENSIIMICTRTCTHVRVKVHTTFEKRHTTCTVHVRVQYVCHTFGNISVLPEVRKYFRTTNVAGLLPEVMGLYGSASLLPDLLTVLQSF